MATVVIIHAAEDALPARALAEKLRQAKLTVVLEKQPGEEQRAAFKGAQVTIALWSPRSVSQQALADDVAFARGKTKIVHACMQNAVVPDAFRSDKTVNLTGWRGEDEFPAWLDLAKLVTSAAGVAPLPPPAPRPPSGFFQPGMVNPQAMAEADRRGPAPPRRAGLASTPQSVQPPSARSAAPPQKQRSAPAPQQQRAAAPAPRPQPTPQRIQNDPPAREKGGGGRGMLIGIIALVVVAVAGGGGYWFWTQQNSAQTTSAAWDAVDSNDAGAIRAFLSGDPGEYRDEAQTALAQLEERTFEAASDSDTIEAFEAFLNDFPESQHALAARGRIAELQTMTPTPPAGEEALPEATDPDLVPPGATATPPDTGGPATIAPPAPEPAPETPPDGAGPTN